MGKRLTCEYKSLKDIDWKLVIYEPSSAKETNAEFAMETGIKYKLDADSKNIHSRIRTRTVKFDILVYNGGTTDLFIEDLALSHDRQFYIEIYREGTIDFIGWLLNDNITIRNEPSPWTVSLTAVDGLGFLSKFKYTTSTGDRYVGYETALQHIFNCLEKILIEDYYGSSQDYLWVQCNWYESQMVSLDDNPLVKTQILHEVFYQESENRNQILADQGSQYIQNNEGFFNCYQVLERILHRWDLRISYCQGKYIIDQVSQRLNPNVRFFQYSKLETLLGTSTMNMDEDSGSSTIKPMADGSFSYLTPLNRVTEKLKTGVNGNLISGIFWDQDNEDEWPLTEAEAVDNAYLDCLFNFKRTTETTEPTWVNFRFHWRIKIQVGSKYLQRTADGIKPTPSGAFIVDYSDITWESSESYFEYVSAIMYGPNTSPQEPEYPSQFEGTLRIQTPALLESGQINVKVELYQYTEEDLTPLAISGFPILYNASWESTQNALFVINDNGAPAEDSYTLYQSLGDPLNVERIDTKMNFGDLPVQVFSYTGMRVYNGSTWERSQNWGINTLSGNTKISQLTVQQMMAVRNIPLKNMDMEFFMINGYFESINRISYDGSEWMILSGEFNTNEDYWLAEFVAIDKQEAGITDEAGDLYPGMPDLAIGSPDDKYLMDPPEPEEYNGDPDVLIYDIAVLTTLTEGLDSDGGAITQLPVNVPGETYFFEGDEIKITHPVTGDTQSWIVSSDVGPSDTTINVESQVPDFDFPTGSPVSLSPASSSGAKIQQETFDVSGTQTELTVTAFTLPDKATASLGSIRRKYHIYRNGQKMKFLVSPTAGNFFEVTFDVTGGNNDLVPGASFEDGEFIEIFKHP